jgi:erythrin-vacuolar iron transport family protein
MRGFESLSEQEILALAITLEEEDEKIYANFAEGLRQDFPATAAVFDGMRVEESGHRRRLIELSQKEFGDYIPLIRRQDVRGFVNRKPVWMTRPLRLEVVRNTVASMELETRQFYERAAARSSPTRTFASCWTTWRRKSACMSTAPANWRPTSSAATCA